MTVTWAEVLGLIGVTLVISTGKIFNGIREYLKDFVHPWNPLRWAGDIISCSMCSGVWVGVVWAVGRGDPFWSVVLFGGFISLASFIASEVLGFIGITTMRISRGMRQQQVPMGTRVASLAGARARPRKHTVQPGEDITEEEADMLLDEEDRGADAMVSHPDEAA